MSDNKDSVFSSLPDNLPKGEPKEEKKPLPEPLQGKSAEEVYSMLQQEHVREMEKSNLELEKARLDAQKPPEVVKTATKPAYNPPPPVQNYQQPVQQNKPDLWSNPDGFMDQQFQKRVGPLINQFATSLRQTHKTNFRQKVGEEFYEKYGDEIERFVDGLHPMVQKEAKAYEVANNFIRGQHQDEILQSKVEGQLESKVKEVLVNMGIDEEKVQSAFGGKSEDVQTNNYSNGSLFQGTVGVIPQTARATVHKPNGKRKTKLDNIQKKVASAFGMSDDEYDQWGELNTDIVSELRRRR